MEDSEYKEIVLEIYNAVSAPALWPGILDRIVETVSGRGCIIFEWQLYERGRRLRAPFMTSNYERDLMENYLTKYSDWENRDQDLFERQSLEQDMVELVSEDDLYPDEAAYLAQPHVDELLQYGIRHRYGCMLDKDNPYRSRFSIQRSPGQGRFGSAEDEILRMLLPHIAKALDLGSQLAQGRTERDTFLSLIDRLSVGICFLDAGGRVAARNELFRAHEDTFRAFRVDRSGRLSMTAPTANRRFMAMLSDALSHGRFGARPRKEAIIATASDRSMQLCVEVAPLDRSVEHGSRPFNGAIVVTRDLCQPIDVDLELARVTFALTAAEAEVVSLLCQGLTNIQIAEHRGRSVETINAQVKSILSKSRASNRTQFVRLLCNFVTPFSDLRRHELSDMASHL